MIAEMVHQFTGNEKEAHQRHNTSIRRLQKMSRPHKLPKLLQIISIRSACCNMFTSNVMSNIHCLFLNSTSTTRHAGMWQSMVSAMMMNHISCCAVKLTINVWHFQWTWCIVPQLVMVRAMQQSCFIPGLKLTVDLSITGLIGKIDYCNLPGQKNAVNYKWHILHDQYIHHTNPFIIANNKLKY